MSDALQGFPPPTDPNLLVGFESSDDAAVYRVTEQLAVISTVDFITPPVDEPVWFGRIGAANALSDVYAMGGRPITALNLVMFPIKKLGMEVLREILRGSHEKVSEAGASLAGGHSVDDLEPKFGLAVTGLVAANRVLTNTGARPGDALILTKPLGTGVLFNACRAGKLAWRDLEELLPQVAALNGPALNVALEFEVHACTDVTGFGILGHALEMAHGSGVQIELFFGALPFYPHAEEMYRRGETTGSNKANRQLVEGFLELDAKVATESRELLFDPQTSGGLLLAVPSSQAEELLQKLKEAGVTAAARVGRATEALHPRIKVV